MKDDWCQMQHTFITEKVNRGDLLLYQSPVLKNKNKNKTIYNKIYVNRLAASSSGLRVIAKYVYKFVNSLKYHYTHVILKKHCMLF